MIHWKLVGKAISLYKFIDLSRNLQSTLPKSNSPSQIISQAKGLFESSFLYVSIVFLPLIRFFLNQSQSHFFSPNGFDIGRVECTYTVCMIHLVKE